MAEQPEHDDTEQQRIRAHFRAALARAAAVPTEVRDAEVRIVRETAAARRRSAA